MYNFTSDWVSGNIPNWRKWLDSLAHKEKARILEIGSYEGRSTTWFLDNILTHPTASITCIDPFWEKERKERFLFNVARSANGHKVTLVQDHSQNILPNFVQNKAVRFDAIYVDGSHVATDLLLDLLYSSRLILPTGVVIVDDYGWQESDGPRKAIDAFLSVAAVDVIHKGYQVAFTL